MYSCQLVSVFPPSCSKFLFCIRLQGQVGEITPYRSKVRPRIELHGDHQCRLLAAILRGRGQITISSFERGGTSNDRARSKAPPVQRNDEIVI